MMHLGSTYLIVQDMARSLAFYEALFEAPPAFRNRDRWAEFHVDGSCIALLNPAFDQAIICEGRDLEAHYNEAYLAFKRDNPIRHGNAVVLNFWVEDLAAEYERVRRLNTGAVSAILYINVAAPYYCFVLTDPDGNPIEITGRYEPNAVRPAGG